MDSISEKNINKVRNYISNICSEFYIWRALQKSENNELYNKNKNFWLPVLNCLQNEFLLNLAKIFEPVKYDILSIYYLISLLPEGQKKEEIKKEIDNYKLVIKNLMVWRHNFLAHQNRYFAHNLSELFKKFPIKNNELEEIIDLLGKILGEIHSFITEGGIAYNYSLMKEESEIDANSVIKHLKIGYESEKERRKKELDSFRKEVN